MINPIIGTPTEENDNDPVEVRMYELQSSGSDPALQYNLSYPPTSPIYYDGLVDGQPQHYWVYYPNGMIVWSQNTCAEVLYGPIFDYYDQTGQFNGHLGSPTTDVTQSPDDGTSYAVFENGVLYLKAGGNATAEELQPLSASYLQSHWGYDTTADGIAALAQQKLNNLANQALQSNPQFKANVKSVTATVQFDSVGGGGCTGASFNSPGITNLRSHIFRVHFDFALSGCAGVFGSASADLHVTIQISVSPPSIQAFLVTYTIDNVTSPGGVGNNAISSGITSAFNQEYGQDLLGLSLPTAFSILAVIVDTLGNVKIYLKQLCTTTSLLRITAQPRSEATLEQIRRLRDDYLLQKSYGQDFVYNVDVLGPILIAAIEAQPDASHLRESISHFLVSTFHERVDLKKVSREITPPATRMIKLLSVASRKGDPSLTDRFVSGALAFIRKHLTEGADFPTVMASLAREMDEEIKYVKRLKNHSNTLA